MRKRLIWPVVAALGLTFGLVAPSPSASAADAVPQKLSPQIQQIVDNLPALRERAEAVKAKLGVEDNPVQDAVIDAIDPTQYECSDATPPVVAAIMPDVTNWTFEQRLAILHVLLFNMALMDAAYLPQTGPFTYGARGEFSNQVNRTIRDLKRFWDIPSGDVELVPAHGRSMLDDSVRLPRTIRGQFFVDEAVREDFAAFVKSLVDEDDLRESKDPKSRENDGDDNDETENLVEKTDSGKPTREIIERRHGIVIGY